MQTFMYRGKSIHIVPQQRKGRTVYYIVVSGRPISFVSNPNTAKRIATNFIDLCLGEDFHEERQLYQGGSKLNDLNSWRRKHN